MVGAVLCSLQAFNDEGRGGRSSSRQAWKARLAMARGLVRPLLIGAFTRTITRSLAGSCGTTSDTQKEPVTITVSDRLAKGAKLLNVLLEK